MIPVILALALAFPGVEVAPSVSAGPSAAALQRPTARTTAIDFSTSPPTCSSGACAAALSGTAAFAGKAIAYDAARGAERIYYTTAPSANQSAAVLVSATGSFDFSTSDRFSLELSYPNAAAAQTSIWMQFCSDATFSSCANYVLGSTYASGAFVNGNHPTRYTHVFTKAQLTATGSINWAAVKHVEIRLLRNGGGSTDLAEVFVHALYSHVAAKPKVMIAFDDGLKAMCDNAPAILAAAGMRANVFLIGSKLYDGSTYCSVAQLEAMYAAGWDFGGHTWDHVRVGGNPASGQYSRSTLVATLALDATRPLKKTTAAGPGNIGDAIQAGNEIVVAGCDEPQWNGTFSVTGVTNAYTVTFNLGSAPGATSANGRCRVVNFYPPGDAATAGTTAYQIAHTREWLANGSASGGAVTHAPWPRGANFMAWPYGAYDWDTMSIAAQQGVTFARVVSTTLPGPIYYMPVFDGAGSGRGTDTLEFPSFQMDNVTAVTALAQVDAAVAAQGSIMLFAHALGAVGDGSTMVTSEFQALVDGLKTRRDAGTLDVVTISEWMRKPAR